jgi:hypothetical protein
MGAEEFSALVSVPMSAFHCRCPSASTKNPEQEYFADGMVEEIITALSRIRWLFGARR